MQDNALHIRFHLLQNIVPRGLLHVWQWQLRNIDEVVGNGAIFDKSYYITSYQRYVVG